MRERSELRKEVDELMSWIDCELTLARRRVQSLEELYQKGEELRDRVGGLGSVRSNIESVGAWMDEVRWEE